MLPSKTMKHLIVATGTGLIFLDVSNPLNAIFLSKYSTNEVFSLSLSSGEEYLMATCEKHFKVHSIQSPANPSLIDTLKFAGKIQQSIFSRYDEGNDISTIAHPNLLSVTYAGANVNAGSWLDSK